MKITKVHFLFALITVEDLFFQLRFVNEEVFMFFMWANFCYGKFFVNLFLPNKWKARWNHNMTSSL